MRKLLLMVTAIAPAVVFAIAGIGMLRDPFPTATLFADSLGTSLRTGFVVTRVVGILGLCLAVSLAAVLGRSRLPAQFGLVGILPLVLILYRIAQGPP